jgi:hypothetical protein
MFKCINRDANTEFFKCFAGGSLAIFTPTAEQIQHVGKRNVRIIVPAIDQNMIVNEERDFRAVKISFAARDPILDHIGLFYDQHDLADMITGFHMRMGLGGIGERKTLVHHRFQLARFHVRPDIAV